MLNLIEYYADLLRKGGLIGFPTETVYGLGASAFCQEAIQRLFQVKKRPSNNPLSVHISNLDQLALVAHRVSGFDALAEAFFPGPLTILLPRKEEVPLSVSAGLPYIGVRMPSHPLARELIELVGLPIVGSSANFSGKPSSTTAQHVLDDFDGLIDGVLDGGPCLLGIESTVLSLDPSPIIVRQGAITAAQIERVLKQPVALAHRERDQHLSPGMKYKAYAPKAKVVVFQSQEESMPYLAAPSSLRRLVRQGLRADELYALFRHADQEGYDEIVICCDEEMQKDTALMSRLLSDAP